MKPINLIKVEKEPTKDYSLVDPNVFTISLFNSIHNTYLDNFVKSYSIDKGKIFLTMKVMNYNINEIVSRKNFIKRIRIDLFECLAYKIEKREPLVTFDYFITFDYINVENAYDTYNAKEKLKIVLVYNITQ